METAEQPRFDLVRRWDEERRQRGWWHSFELPDGSLIDGVCSIESLKYRISQFPIPEDLRGKRVLDIGAWDGWFSFEMERRGAEVVAIDNWDNPRFHEARRLLNSKVDYRVIDVYEVTPERVGRFDIVLFMGVLYHLKHPLLGLERVCAVTTEMAAVDSFVLREEHRPGEEVERRPVMEFYETDEFGGQTDNWCAPSLSCLEAFCRTAGFARVEVAAVLENSAALACYRTWPDAVEDVDGPAVSAVSNNWWNGINFESARDELVSAWFRWPAEKLGLDDVRPEVGGYGVRPIYVSAVGDSKWQTNFKLPPGLKAGWHDVAIRIGESRPGDAMRVAVDIPIRVRSIRVDGTRDGATWAEGQIDLARGEILAVWIAGLPANADAANLRAELAGRRLEVAYVGPGDSLRQVNLQVPPDFPAGTAELAMSIGAARASAEVQVVR